MSLHFSLSFHFAPGGGGGGGGGGVDSIDTDQTAQMGRLV